MKPLTHPNAGDKRVLRIDAAWVAFRTLVPRQNYQVEIYRGDGFGWDVLSTHETYREAVAAKNAHRQ